MENTQTTEHYQKIYNPYDFGFSWVEDWYKWDAASARKEALKMRNDAAKWYQSQGFQVRKFTLSQQLITRGGIGSGHPEISHVVSVYGFNAWR